MTATTKTVHATLSYEVSGQTFAETVQATVPASTQWHQWVTTLIENTRERISALGAKNYVLDYRLDGSTKPLTKWEYICDVWHRWTWRGTPYTGNRFVPIWDRPRG
jgi:hypothetical protein